MYAAGSGRYRMGATWAIFLKNSAFRSSFVPLLFIDPEAGVAPNSVDVIVSNCVINLAADKQKVLQEAFHVLKEGGEIFFSDIYSDKVSDRFFTSSCSSAILIV